MAGKADFTEDEWKALEKGVTGSGMLVSVADRDFTDSFGEASSLAKYLAEQRERSASELVRELTGVRGTGFGLTASPQKIEAETLDALRVATTTLETKAPDEVGAYRELAVGLAEHVASAKGEVSDTETAAIDKIKAALGS